MALLSFCQQWAMAPMTFVLTNGRWVKKEHENTRRASSGVGTQVQEELEVGDGSVVVLRSW